MNFESSCVMVTLFTVLTTIIVGILCYTSLPTWASHLTTLSWDGQLQFGKQPQYIQKIIRLLQSFQGRPNIDLEEVKVAITPLLRYPHLVECFTQCFPSQPPPPRSGYTSLFTCWLWGRFVWCKIVIFHPFYFVILIKFYYRGYHKPFL